MAKEVLSNFVIRVSGLLTPMIGSEPENVKLAEVRSKKQAVHGSDRRRRRRQVDDPGVASRLTDVADLVDRLDLEGVGAG